MNIIYIISPPSKSLYERFSSNFDKEYNIIYIPEIIRQNLCKNQITGTSIKKNISEGIPIKDLELCDLIYGEIIKKKGNNIILGFPRTINQLNLFEENFRYSKLNLKFIGIFLKKEDSLLKQSFSQKNKMFIEVSNFNKPNELVSEINDFFSSVP